jgi:hypothetical protein
MPRNFHQILTLSQKRKLYYTTFILDSSVPNSSRYTGPSSKDHPLLVYCCYREKKVYPRGTATVFGSREVKL